MDVAAYFQRIGYRGPRTPDLALLSALTDAHTRSIPFENLNVLLGRTIELAPQALFQKLVVERRGGYCFEQNGLFLEVLSELGFRVAPISARVRLQRPRDFTPPRTHVFLRVELGGESWLTDVGVGGLSLTSPLRLVTDVEQPTLHEPRRIVQEGARFFHQVRFGATWEDVCEFTLEEMPAIDRELANWYTSAHPASHFKNRLIVARAVAEGRRVTLLNDELTFRDRFGVATTHRVATAGELLTVLRDQFDLHFPEGTRFGWNGEPVASLAVERQAASTLFLARHGETEWNRVGRWQGRTDIPLSDVGRAQARSLAARLRGRGIVRIHASDLARARETAEIVAAELGVLGVECDPRLRERGFGCFEGLTREQCADHHAEAWQRYVADRRDTPPDAEPYEEVVARVLAGLTAVAESAARSGPTLVVSHGAAIRSFVHSVTGSAPPPLANTALFQLRYGAAGFDSIDPE